MNPWNILGWIFVILIGGPIALKILGFLIESYGRVYHYIQKYIRHLRTRKIAPAIDQRWRWKTLVATITSVDNIRDGLVYLRYGSGSYDRVKLEEWQEWVDKRGAYLIM